MSTHLIDGEFQSDKYPTTPRGKVPLSVKDPTAQDLLWEYADRRQSVDAEFSTDLRAALLVAGYHPAEETDAQRLRAEVQRLHAENEKLRGIDVSNVGDMIALSDDNATLRAECERMRPTFEAAKVWREERAVVDAENDRLSARLHRGEMVTLPIVNALTPDGRVVCVSPSPEDRLRAVLDAALASDSKEPAR